MKDVDNTIMIIGPEMEYANSTYLGPLFAAPGTSASITGTISTGGGQGKYFVDYLSFHNYGGFSPTIWTTSNTDPNRKKYVDEGYQFVSTFSTAYTSYVSTYSTRPVPLKMIVNELNMHNNSQTPSTNTTSNTSDITNDIPSGNTFLAGQLLIDILGSMLTVKEGTNNICPYEFSNVWSIGESQETMGLVHNGTDKKPTYWHFWLMANYFNGVFFPNLRTDPGAGNLNRCFKAYACKSGDYIVVLVMNQAETTGTNTAIVNGSGSKNFTINFDNQGTPDFKFDMSQSTWGASNYSGTINNRSTALLFFKCDQANPTAAYLGRYDIDESWVSSHLTATAPPYSGTAVTVLSLTPSGTSCKSNSTNASLSAPGTATATWYKAPDFSTTYSTNVNSIAGTAGLYHAKITGTCGDTWLAACLHENSPIVSRTQPVVLGCTSGAAPRMAVEEGVQSYTWSPSANLSYPNAGHTSTVDAPSSIPSTIYTVSSTNGCITSETISVSMYDGLPQNNMLRMKDDANDTGVEANTITSTFYNSPDMFLSATPNGTPLNAGQYIGDSTPSYMNVIVTNSGSNTAEGQLEVYWGKAGIVQAWPDTWNDYTDSINGKLVTCGDMIGTPTLISVPGSSSDTISLPWVVPNPALYTASTNTTTDFHFCAVAVIRTGCSAITGTYVLTLARNYNKFIWKNFSILSGAIKFWLHGSVDVGDIRTVTNPPGNRIVIRANTNGSGENLFDYGYVDLEMTNDLYNLWTDGGSHGTNVQDIGNNKIRVTASTATLSGFTFDNEEKYPLGLQFEFTRQAPLTDRYVVDIEQYDEYSSSDTLAGGFRFEVVPPTCPTVAPEQDTVVIDRYCVADLFVDNPNPDLDYSWIESDGNTIATGTHVAITPTASGTYTLMVDNGCIATATCYVQVDGVVCSSPRSSSVTGLESLSSPEINHMMLIPNPASDQVQIVYPSPGGENAELMISNIYGQVLHRFKINNASTSFDLDCHRFANGLYTVTLISSGTIIGNERLVIAK